MIESLIDFDRLEGKPHVFIQWKGTDACLDLYCVCGSRGHIDSDFVYFASCSNCGRVYELDCFVEMYEVTDEKAKTDLETDGRLHGFGGDND